MGIETITFGAGDLWLKEQSGATPKAFKAATLVGATLGASRERVKLMTGSAFAKDVALGEGSLTGKLSFGALEPAFMRAALPGSAEAVGYEEMSTTVQAIPATPYQVTITNFKEDYGVRFADTRVELLRVASAPATGQYSVVDATGVYTFAAADQAAGKQVEITAVKTVAASGATIELTNQLQGAGAVWKLRLWNEYRTKKIGYYLASVILGSLGALDFTAGQHTKPEIEFEAVESPTEVGADGKPLIWRMFRSA